MSIWGREVLDDEAAMQLWRTLQTRVDELGVRANLFRVQQVRE